MLHMCFCMHSDFTENHSIWVLEDGPLISEVVPLQACFTVASTLARWGDVEHGLESTVLHGERGAAWRGGWFPVTTPPSIGETSSWLEHSPTVLWFWQG
jgi:hypothetical protein